MAGARSTPPQSGDEPVFCPQCGGRLEIAADGKPWGCARCARPLASAVGPGSRRRLNLRSAATFYCTHCGLRQTSTGRGDPAVICGGCGRAVRAPLLLTAMTQVPAVEAPPVAPPPPPPPRSAQPAWRQTPRQKKGSGCGCVTMLMILGAIAFAGRCARESSGPADRPAPRYMPPPGRNRPPLSPAAPGKGDVSHHGRATATVGSTLE